MFQNWAIFEKSWCDILWLSLKSSQNWWLIFGSKWKATSFSKDYYGSFLGNFWKTWGTFNFNIWCFQLWIAILPREQFFLSYCLTLSELWTFALFDPSPFNDVKIYLGRSCGPVGRVVASNTRDQRFESSHCLFYLLSTLLKTVLKRRK